MKTILISILFFITLYAQTKDDCTHLGNWAESISYNALIDKNIMNSDEMDYNKTKTILLAKEKIGKDLNKNVFLIKFVLKDKKIIEVIAISNSSSEECSISGVDVFLIKSKISDKSDI